MEALFIIAALILFLAWIGGLVASTNGFWNHFIGNQDLRHRLRKPLYHKKRAA
jgi:hypothetical protein